MPQIDVFLELPTQKAPFALTPFSLSYQKCPFCGASSSDSFVIGHFECYHLLWLQNPVEQESLR